MAGHYRYNQVYVQQHFVSERHKVRGIQWIKRSSSNYVEGQQIVQNYVHTGWLDSLVAKVSNLWLSGC